MGKHKSSLFASLVGKQKIDSVISFGQKSQSKHLPLLTRLSLSIYFLLGSSVAVLIGVFSPIYFYPGTMAAEVASKTITNFNNQALIPAEKSLTSFFGSVKIKPSDLLGEAPFSLSALFHLPKVDLPKLPLPSPVLAESKEKPGAQDSQLLAETIKGGLDPMISSPNNVLFPPEVSLPSDTGTTDSVAQSAVPVEEKKEPEAVVTQAPEPVREVVLPPSTPPPASQPATGASFTGSYRWPVSGVISQGFSTYHPAIDIATKYGTSVYPVEDGLVLQVISQDFGLGKHIVIQHPDGMTSTYAHLSELWVSVGQQVNKNMVIGAVGLTGMTTGPHLHFETRMDGRPFSPLGRILN